MTLLLTEADVAQSLAITRAELKRLVKTGSVPVVSIPLPTVVVRFDPRDIARAVETWKLPSTNE